VRLTDPERAAREIAEELRRMGFTERQVEAGVKYYLNFASKFDVTKPKALRMVANMVRNMRSAVESLDAQPP
jgi:predicted transcriptional regulator